MWETNNIQSPVYSSERDTRLSLYATSINISENKNNSIFFYYLSLWKTVGRLKSSNNNENILKQYKLILTIVKLKDFDKNFNYIQLIIISESWLLK